MYDKQMNDLMSVNTLLCLTNTIYILIWAPYP